MKATMEQPKSAKKKDENNSKESKKVQKNRPNWIYINVKREHYNELQEIVDREGRQLNITDAKELLRLIVFQIGVKYRESANFADAVESTYIDMFPTIKHYEELRGIITKHFGDYVKFLQQEQKRREREREKAR